ncbi:MAG: CDP-alcohol phosphatidyltransferase family protein [Ruminococcaceae bacterium]|nr:CDP-alcohol phosphatidyltransferase family protein [Oscillospiraceae bacterium]
MDNENEKYQKKIITIPNLLSFLRILMIPPLVWLYCVKEDYFGTLVLLTVSSLTDIADGIIARKFNMVSDFGKAFDPVADKLTQAVMLFCLTSRFKLMLFPLLLLVVKETIAAVTGILSIKKSGEVMGALWHGKAATVMLYIIMAVHIIWFDLPAYVSFLLILLCTAMMIISAVLYSIRNIKVIISYMR